MMERSEIAENICEALYAGQVAASLASVVDDQARWALVSSLSNRHCLIPPLQRSTFKDLLDYAALQTFVGMLSRLHQAI
jgi:hypothetical protein